MTLTADNLASYDAVVLATDHDKFDYELVKQHANLIIDARGKYRGQCEKVIKA